MTKLIRFVSSEAWPWLDSAKMITCLCKSSRVSSTLLFRHLSSVIIKEGDPTSSAIWNAAKPFKSIPGPPSYPLVGALPSLIRDGKDKSLENNYSLKWLRKLGPFVRVDNPSYIGGRQLFCYDPELLKLLLQTGKNHSRHTSMEAKMTSVHNKMKTPPFMFFASGKMWRTMRSAMNKPSTPRRVALFSSQLYDVANELGQHWIDKSDDTGLVDDIRNDLQKWALKGVTWFAFNKNLSVFGEFDEMSEEFNQASINFIENIPIILQALPLYNIYPTAPYKSYSNSVYNLHALGEKMLQSRYNEIEKLIEKGQEIDGDRISVMEHLLIEGILTKEEALSQVCDLLAAGVDTTSSTALFLLHHIAKDPQLQQALFDEISSVCGKKAPDFADLQKLSLVRNCVKEILRVYPPVMVLLRVAESDLVVHGYQIPKNTSILFNLTMMGRDPKLYPNPTAFDPYRWNNKELDDKLVSFANLPFGAGVRMCYGRRLAELELHMLLVSLVQRFILSTDQTSLNAVIVSVIKSADPVRLFLQER